MVRLVVLLLLAGFLTRAVAWDIEARVVDHAIEHATAAQAPAQARGSYAGTGLANDAHAHEHDSEGTAHDEGAPAAHEILHALAGLQLIGGSVRVALPVVSAIASEFLAPLSPPTSWDASAPFRPPRRR